MVSDLIERLHPPLSKQLSVGVEVVTPRGYGIIASFTGDGLENFGSSMYFGPPRRPTRFVVVELEDGSRCPFRAQELQVVERVGA
jgi:hypothetical protein